MEEIIFKVGETYSTKIDLNSKFTITKDPYVYDDFGNAIKLSDMVLGIHNSDNKSEEKLLNIDQLIVKHHRINEIKQNVDHQLPFFDLFSNHYF